MRHRAVRIAAVMAWALPALVMAAGPASAHPSSLHPSSLHPLSLHPLSLHPSSLHTSSLHTSSLHTSSLHTSSLQSALLHTSLKAASPGIGSTVSPPSRIVLTFADPVGFPQVVLTGPAGARHESGKAQAVDATVTEQVAGRLPPGVYTVGWRVVATDGHPVSGTYRFSVGGAPGAGPAKDPGTGGGASRTTAPGEASSGAAWWWVGLAGLLVAGAAGAVFTRRSLRRDDPSRPSAPDLPS